MKVAIVYDRVNKWGGAERVLLALQEIFPEAHLFTSVYHQKNATWAQSFVEVKPSFLQKIKFFQSHHELIPFLMPLAFESFNFKDYDLVISVSSEAAKGVITKNNTVHINYCLTPTRYLWSGSNDYFKDKRLKFVSTPFINYLKYWDKVASSRPDEMVAISKVVQKRIKKILQS